MTLRRVLVMAHRWFGLAGALWLFLLGLTGALLVFYTELDHALNPELFGTRRGVVTAHVDQAIDMVEAARAGRVISSFWMQEDPADAWTFRVTDPDIDEAREVMFDPVASKVLGERIWSELTVDRAHAMPLIYAFHYSLLAGAWGEWLIGLVGFLWLLDHIVAAIVAFPVAQRWKQSFKIRKSLGHKLVFDLHRAVGLWLLGITLIVAATGSYMNWRPYAQAIIGIFSTTTPWPGSDRPERAAPLVDPPLSFGGALAVAKVSRPQGAFYDPARAIYTVSAFDPRDLTADYGQLYTVVDASSGRLLSRRHIGHGSTADVIEAWQLPLHSGKIAGWPGRIAICLSGVTLCLFVMTGLMLWTRKRKAAAHRQGRRSIVGLMGAGRP